MANNYNTTLQSNNTDLQAILSAINELPNAGGEQATPVISVNNSNGLITATAGTKSSTYQMAFQAAQTITPGTTNKTIAANTYLGGVQTIKGDANLVASNIVSGKSIFGVVGTAATGGSNEGDLTSLFNQTIVTCVNDNVTAIPDAAFQGCMQLTTVVCPNASRIGGSAFKNCYYLTSIGLSSVKYIDTYAFFNCSRLTQVNFPLVSAISDNALAYCPSLTTAIFPSLQAIPYRAFDSCTHLVSTSFPRVSTIGSRAFISCNSLETISFPRVSYISSYAFYFCGNLSEIYLKSTSVCSLINSNAFMNTNIRSNEGSIFVPASLVSAYKSATNWAYFSNRIFGA